MIAALAFAFFALPAPAAFAWSPYGFPNQEAHDENSDAREKGYINISDTNR